MTSHNDNQRVITTCQLPCQLFFAPRELKFWWRQPSTEPTSSEHLDLGLCTTRTEVRSKAHQMFQHLATTLLLGAELDLEENYNFNTESNIPS
jgi:hypothetical protein